MKTKNGTLIIENKEDQDLLEDCIDSFLCYMEEDEDDVKENEYWEEYKEYKARINNQVNYGWDSYPFSHIVRAFRYKPLAHCMYFKKIIKCLELTGSVLVVYDYEESK